MKIQVEKKTVKEQGAQLRRGEYLGRRGDISVEL